MEHRKLKPWVYIVFDILVCAVFVITVLSLLAIEAGIVYGG